jgi:hypothetical protein
MYPQPEQPAGTGGGGSEVGDRRQPGGDGRGPGATPGPRDLQYFDRPGFQARGGSRAYIQGSSAVFSGTAAACGRGRGRV